MTDNEKSLPPSQGSSSESASPSRDALDSVSFQEQTEALRGLRLRLDSALDRKDEDARKYKFLVDMLNDTLKKSAIAEEQREKREKRANERTDAFIKLVKEVMKGERGAVEVLREVSQKIVTHVPESDEITGPQWRYFFKTKVAPVTKYLPAVAKVLGVIASVVAAGVVGAWAYVKHLAQHIRN